MKLKNTRAELLPSFFSLILILCVCCFAGNIYGQSCSTCYDNCLVEPGEAFVTCGSYPPVNSSNLGQQDLTAPVIAVFDIKDPQANGGVLGGNWATPASTAYHPTMWSAESLGEVHGITTKPNLTSGCMDYYVAQWGLTPGGIMEESTISHGTLASTCNGGAIFKIDGTTGTPSVFACLPSTRPVIAQQFDADGSSGGGGYVGSFDTYTGLGQITYNKDCDVFYVSNFDNGLVYALDANGNTIGTYDFGMDGLPALLTNDGSMYHHANYVDGNNQIPDDTNEAHTQWYRKVFGLGYNKHEQKLYFGTVRKRFPDDPNHYGTQATTQQVFSVDIDPNTCLPIASTTTQQLAIDQGIKSPVADIHFDVNNNMLLSEMSMTTIGTKGAHDADLILAKGGTGSWAINTLYKTSTYASEGGSAGGVDFGYNNFGSNTDTANGNCPEESVVFTVDAALGINEGSAIYGLGSFNWSGGDLSTNAYFVDADASLEVRNKYVMGDIDVISPSCNLTSLNLSCSTDGTTFTISPNCVEDILCDYTITASQGTITNTRTNSTNSGNPCYVETFTYVPDDCNNASNITVTINSCDGSKLCTLTETLTCCVEQPTCTNPTVTAYALAASCTNGVPNDDGYLQISAAADATHYNYIMGSDYNTGDADIANATTLGTLPLQFGTLPNPTGSQDYTIRVFNGASDCFTDVTVILQEQDCTTTCSCDEYIYLNETTNDGAIHKFKVNGDFDQTTDPATASITEEIGSPWFDNAAIGENVTNPHGLGSDLNGFLYVGETSTATLGGIRRLTCDGEIIPSSEFYINDTGFSIGSDGNRLYVGHNAWGDVVTDNTVNVYDLCTGNHLGFYCLDGISARSDWGLYIADDGNMYVTNDFLAEGNAAGADNNLYIFNIHTEPLNMVGDTGTCISPFIVQGDTPPTIGQNYFARDRVFGVTTDAMNNIYIIERTFDGEPDFPGGIPDGSARLLKYDSSGSLLAITPYDSVEGDGGYFKAIGIYYSEVLDLFFVSTTSPTDDCVSLFDTDLNYLGAAIPATNDSTQAKGISILTECCPVPNRQTLSQTYCVSGSNEQLFLNELFPCDGVICEGQWIPADATAEAVYNACDQSISENIAPGCYSFTKGSDGLENYPKCGAFQLDFNLEILEAPEITLSADETICNGGTTTLSVTTTATDIQWQMSTTSCTEGFTDIDGATSATYTTATLNDTTYYRAIVNATGNCSDGSCPFESDCITISTDPNCPPPYDVRLSKTVNQDISELDSTVVFTITVYNEGSDVTGATVTDILPNGSVYITDDANGAYNNSTGIWTIGDMAAGDSAKLNLTVQLTQEGVLINEAFVTINEEETDTTNNNDKACVSIPVELCDDGSQSLDAVAEAGYTSYQWYIDTGDGSGYVAISGATQQTLTISAAGSYMYTVEDAEVGNCGDQMCCPIIVELVPCAVCPSKLCIPISITKK